MHFVSVSLSNIKKNFLLLTLSLNLLVYSSSRQRAEV